ncbi:MAG: hypothetical protein ACMZ7B_12375 [Balneola sp.]
MRLQLLPLYFSILIFASCAIPAPISQLSPDEKHDSFWLNGRQVLYQAKDSIFVEVSFYERQENLFIFDITMINESGNNVLIDPSVVFYIPISSTGDTLRSISAVNPETKILEQQMRINKLDAKRRSEARSALLFGSLELAASLSGDYPSEDNEPNALDRYYIETARIDAETIGVLEQKEYWETQPVRKTTLFDDHYTTGQIFLKYRKKVDKLGLIIPLGNQQFEFWFNHSEIKHQDFR